MIVVALAWAGIGAAANRLRGGWGGDAIRHVIASAFALPIGLFLPPVKALLTGAYIAHIIWGTGGARMIAWGGPAAFAAWMAGAPPLGVLALCLAAWAGCTPPNSKGLSMGNRGGLTGDAAWRYMALWGIARVAPEIGVMAILAALRGVPPINAALALAPFFAAGVICPALYAVVWRAPTWAFLPGIGRGDGPPNYDPPELAEAAHGASMAPGRFIALTAIFA